MAKNGLSAAIEALCGDPAARDALARKLCGMTFEQLTAPEHHSQIELREALRAHFGAADNPAVAAAVQARVAELAADPASPLAPAAAATRLAAVERALTRHFSDDREPARRWRPTVERYGSCPTDDARTTAVLSGLLALACVGPQTFRTAEPLAAEGPNALARAIALLAGACEPCPGPAYQQVRNGLALQLAETPFEELAAWPQRGLLARLMERWGAQSPWEAGLHLRHNAHLLAQDGSSPVGARVAAADFGALAKPLLALAFAARDEAQTLRPDYLEWLEYGAYLGTRPEAAPVRTALVSGLLCRCAVDAPRAPLLADEMFLKASVWDEGPLMYLGWALNALVAVAPRAAVGVSAKQAYRYLACELMGKAGQQAAVDSFVKYNYRFVVNDDVAKIRLEVRQSWGGEGGRPSKDETLAGLDAVLSDPANPYLRALWDSQDTAAWLGPRAPFDVLACMADYYRLRGYGSDELQALRHRFDRYRAGFVRTGGPEHARRALRLLLLSTMFGPGDDSAHSGTVSTERPLATPLSWQIVEVEPDLGAPGGPTASYRPLTGPLGETRAELARATGSGGIATLFGEDDPFVIGRAVTEDQERAGRGFVARGRLGANGEAVVPASLYSRVHAKLFFDEGQRLVLANASATLNVRLIRAGGPAASTTDLRPGQRAVLEPGDVFVLSAGSPFANPEHRAVGQELFRSYRVEGR